MHSLEITMQGIYPWFMQRHATHFQYITMLLLLYLQVANLFIGLLQSLLKTCGLDLILFQLLFYYKSHFKLQESCVANHQGIETICISKNFMEFVMYLDEDNTGVPREVPKWLNVYPCWNKWCNGKKII